MESTYLLGTGHGEFFFVLLLLSLLLLLFLCALQWWDRKARPGGVVAL
jgi:hypothetical protein